MVRQVTLLMVGMDMVLVPSERAMHIGNPKWVPRSTRFTRDLKARKSDEK